MGIGKGFGALGVFVMEYEHRGAGASDFGGHLRFGGSPVASGGIGDFEQESGIVFVNERGRFEIAVFDKPHLCHQFTEKPLAFGGYGGGSV
jgi:hypothetical protein